MSKILIVDDDRDIRDNLEVRLRSERFDVSSAENGAEALKLIKEDPPDLVLLDVMMPGMDGFETCEKVKKDTAPHFLPVIMLTALNQTDEKVKGLKAGADDFISKPFEDKELIARVKAFLRIKSLHDQLDASLRELKKLEALKENLTELIVHDLKSPIVSSMASLSLFQTKNKDNAQPVNDVLAKIKRNCRIQLDLIDDILEISRMEHNILKLDKKSIPVVPFIDEIIAQMESIAADKNITLEKSVQENIPLLYGDPGYLRRVIVNLMNNSFKYTPRVGTVGLSVQFDAENSRFRFCVFDTGLGIAGENLNKIFDRFYQVEVSSETARKGVGLGLSFCRMAVEAHGGAIWAESTEGKGSRFYFEI